MKSISVNSAPSHDDTVIKKECRRRNCAHNELSLKYVYVQVRMQEW